MAISATDIKKLREETGAGMLDCKNALLDSSGDFAQAKQLLREKGLAAAAKRSSRTTNEGKIFSRRDEKQVIMLELACETDFVSRNEDFNRMGNQLLTIACENGITEINQQLTDIVAEGAMRIKENLSLRRLKVITAADNQMLIDYIHGDGRIGVTVLAQSDPAEILDQARTKELIFDIALHVAAFNPLYLDKSGLSAEYLADQEKVFHAQVAEMGKPPQVAEGIVKGKMKKHLAEITLMDQGFVKDEKKSVGMMLQEVGKEVGGKIEIKEYLYYRVGEALT